MIGVNTQPGTICRLIVDKGFGFIAATESDAEYFFHRSAVENTSFDQLYEGQTVVFEDGRDSKGKGPRASRVFLP